MSKLTKKEVTEFVLSEFAEHDIVNVAFHWNNDKSRFGAVHYRYNRLLKQQMPYKMTLSETLFRALENSWDVVDTVYHEIAHILAIRDHGRAGVGHGRIWKSYARKLGCSATTCSAARIDHEKVGFKYTAFCRNHCHDMEHGFSRLGSRWLRNYNGERYNVYVCRYCREPLLVRENY